MRTPICALLCLSIWSSPVAAQISPYPTGGNSHIQQVDFLPDQIFRLTSAPGYQLSVQLAPDEQISSVALGDGSSWQATVGDSGNMLFLKPLQAGLTTNMTVITTTRSYAFDLVALDAPSANMPYTVTFRYPVAASNPMMPTAPPSHVTVGRYRLSGSRDLRPAAISDDGEHTYIDWPGEMPLPATYYKDDGGDETLANGHMRDGLYVLDSVHTRLIFRIDNHKAKAKRYVPEPEQ